MSVIGHSCDGTVTARAGGRVGGLPSRLRKSTYTNAASHFRVRTPIPFIASRTNSLTFFCVARSTVWRELQPRPKRVTAKPTLASASEERRAISTGDGPLS